MGVELTVHVSQRVQIANGRPTRSRHDGVFFAIYGAGDPDRGSASALSIYEIGEDRLPVKRIDASSARHVGNSASGR